MTVKGSNVPVDLYTFDVVTVPPHFGCDCKDVTHFMDADFGSNADVAALQQGVSQDFNPLFAAAVASYLRGHWVEARRGLEAAMALRPDDGPSATLLRYMQSWAYTAPAGWAGYRELTEK